MPTLWPDFYADGKTRLSALAWSAEPRSLFLGRQRAREKIAEQQQQIEECHAQLKARPRRLIPFSPRSLTGG